MYCAESEGRGLMQDGLRECAGGADRFAVVDTETTGVYSTDRVIEVAILTLSLDGEVIDTYDTLVNPCRDVSATHIHGITASMVHDAPTFEDIAGDIAVRLHGACLVAHNVPFDRRMLSSEFDRLGDALVVQRSVDTYVGSGTRLSQACADHRIDLTGAHRASVDAFATAQLFLRLQATCGTGQPVAAPPGLRRTGHVRRRDDAAALRLPDTPLISYLASLLPFTGLAVASQQYLEVVGRAVADLHLDASERAELETIAADYGMSEAQVAQAHRRFVNELIDAAAEDNVVTDEEYETLVRVAAALVVDQATVEHRIASFRTQVTETTMTTGMQVVFTGDHPTYERDRLESAARTKGLEPHSGVSKATDLVFAADPLSRSGKAAKARKYGIPVMSIDAFLDAEIGDVRGLRIGRVAEGRDLPRVPCHLDGASNVQRPNTSAVQRLRTPTERSRLQIAHTRRRWGDVSVVRARDRMAELSQLHLCLVPSNIEGPKASFLSDMRGRQPASASNRARRSWLTSARAQGSSGSAAIETPINWRANQRSRSGWCEPRLVMVSLKLLSNWIERFVDPLHFALVERGCETT